MDRIETIYSTGHNPIGDGMALHAIRLLFENLPRCKEGDIDTLLSIKTACAMASWGRFAGLGLNTATCHHVGGLYDVPHGEANAILLPHTMRYNLDACADRQRLVAEAIGVASSGMTDEDAAWRLPTRLTGSAGNWSCQGRYGKWVCPRKGLE